MTSLLELNDSIIYGKKKKTVVPEITNDDLILFKRALQCSSKIKAVYNQTEDANSFFATFPDVKKVIGSRKCVECFYACKMDYYMAGIPAKLLYIVNKMVTESDKKYINVAMNTAVQLLKPYANCSFACDGEAYTLKDVIENVCGNSIKLINTSVRKIQVGKDWEVYIPDVSRVAIMPDGIAGMLSQEDCEHLSFNLDKGIMLGDIPMRTLGDRLGITKDDFDLRECV
jgi:hypothetical protein